MLSNIILARGDGIDLPKIIFVVMFLFVGFVQWLIKLAKQKTEDRLRIQRPPLSEKEKAMRRRGLERSLKKQISPRLPNIPTIGGPMGVLVETLRQTMESSQNSAPPIAPPSLPYTAPKLSESKSAPKSQPVSAANSRRDAALAYPAFVPAAHSGIIPRSPLSKRGHPIVQLLSNKNFARQAVLMKEILGPPKALQSESDALF